MRKVAACALALGLVVPLAPTRTAAQTTLFDNGVDRDGGVTFCGSCTNWTTGFSLSSGATVTGFDLWTAGTTPSNVTWSILASSGGVPASTLASGTSVGVLNGDDGSGYSFGQSFSVASLFLSAGQYWLQVLGSSGSPGLRGDYGTADRVWWDGNPQGSQPLAPYGSDYNIAARITGTSGDVVPEPASVLLLATGLVGLGVAVRRRGRGVEAEA